MYGFLSVTTEVPYYEVSNIRYHLHDVDNCKLYKVQNALSILYYFKCFNQKVNLLDKCLFTYMRHAKL